MNKILSLVELESVIRTHPMVVIYYFSELCNVCKVLKPKMAELLNNRFPGVYLFYIDIEKNPEISGQHRVFTSPTIDVYLEGKEHARFSRNITLPEFERTLSKPYEMLYSKG